jgi:hypothetical protein
LSPTIHAAADVNDPRRRRIHVRPARSIFSKSTEFLSLRNRALRALAVCPEKYWKFPTENLLDVAGDRVTGVLRYVCGSNAI